MSEQEPIKSAHALILNRLNEMQRIPYYAMAKEELALAESTIVNLEREILKKDQELERQRLEVRNTWRTMSGNQNFDGHFWDAVTLIDAANWKRKHDTIQSCQMAWQPIETAPQNEKEFQAWVVCEDGRAWYEPRCKFNNDGDFEIWMRIDHDEEGWETFFSDIKPTHWMPVPTAPASPAPTSGEQSKHYEECPGSYNNGTACMRPVGHKGHCGPPQTRDKHV